MRSIHWITGALMVALVMVMVLAPAGWAQHAHKHHDAAPSGKDRSFQAVISAPSDLLPGQPLTATIQIRDEKGQAVTAFDVFQEKRMHLILVSDDLGFFDHLHPEYLGDGRFLLETSLPAAGGYTLYCDYQPSGAPEQISVLKLSAKGPAPPVARPDMGIREKVVQGTKVHLSFAPASVRKHRDTVVVFDLKRTSDGRPVEGLRPYLGERGHLVILRHSKTLSAGDYIHAHALQQGDASQIRFTAHFPQAGLYKLWCQFDLDGRIHTADFWVRVE